MNKYDLVVVGNGFDLNFGYKTSYFDFIEYLEREPLRNKLAHFFCLAKQIGYLNKPDWNSFEKLLCQYLCFIDYLFSNANVEYYYEKKFSGYAYLYKPYLIIKDLSSLPTNCINILDICNPLEEILTIKIIDKNEELYTLTRISDMSERWQPSSLRIEIFKNFNLPPSKSEVKSHVLEGIDFLLSDLERRLSKFIALETKQKLTASHFLSNCFTKDIQYLLSFNYSHVAQNYFCLDDDSVAYVHGDINSEIVLGIENNMIVGQSINEQSDFAMFFKRGRRFIKKCNERFSEKILSNIGLGSNITIFGHSLDSSDSSIFKILFESNFSHCDIYYFGDEITYRKRLLSLIGLDLTEELYNDDKVSFIKIPCTE